MTSTPNPLQELFDAPNDSRVLALAARADVVFVGKLVEVYHLAATRREQ